MTTVYESQEVERQIEEHLEDERRVDDAELERLVEFLREFANRTEPTLSTIEEESEPASEVVVGEEDNAADDDYNNYDDYDDADGYHSDYCYRHYGYDGYDGYDN